MAESRHGCSGYVGYSPGGQLVAFSGAVAFATFAKTDYSNRSLQTWTWCIWCWSDLTCKASLQSLDEGGGCPGLVVGPPSHHHWDRGRDSGLWWTPMKYLQWVVKSEWAESVPCFWVSKKYMYAAALLELYLYRRRKNFLRLARCYLFTATYIKTS